MKKIVSSILALVLLVCFCGFTTFAVSADEAGVSVWNGTDKATAFSSGTGTEADPFVIMSAAEMNYFADQVNTAAELFAGKYVKLGVNIDWNGNVWPGIGIADKTKAFCGSFDGNGKKIENLTYTGATAALFPYTYTGAEIKDLTVDNAVFTVTDRYAGTFVGLMRDSKGISGCYAGENVVVKSGETMKSSAQAGGIVGWCNSRVEYCVFNGKVEFPTVLKSSFVGGIIGCIANPAATVSTGCVVSYCVNNGTVSVPNATTDSGTSNVAGIAGSNGASKGAGTVENCINNGAVTGHDYAGGIVGSNQYAGGLIKNSYNLGSVVSSTDKAAGCVAYFKTAYGADTANVITVGDASTKTVGEAAATVTLDEADVNAKFLAKSEAEIKALDGYIAIVGAIADKFPSGNDNPDTGDGIAVAVCVAMISLMGSVTVAVALRKKKNEI